MSNPSEKYEFVNWDDEIPNINGKIKLMATNPPSSKMGIYIYIYLSKSLLLMAHGVCIVFASQQLMYPGHLGTDFSSPKAWDVEMSQGFHGEFMGISGGFHGEFMSEFMVF